jgi:hypothetical protein
LLLHDETSKFLPLGKLTSKKDGSYECHVRNSMGSEKVEFQVTVKELPSILSAGKVETNEASDQTATISCIVKGNPMPTVTWFDRDLVVVSTEKINLTKSFARYPIVYLNMNGKEIEPHEIYKINEKFYAQVKSESEGTVRLNVVYKSKYSEDFSNFKCEAENIHGLTKKQVIVDQKELEKPLRFTDDRNGDINVESEVGERVELNCEVESSSASTVRWIFVSIF